MENKQGEQMQHTKYKELKDEIDGLKEKIVAQHRLGQSTLLLLKNYDARIVALTDLCSAAGVFTLDKFEEQADGLLGLRTRAIGEQVKTGDTVWVSYTALTEGDTDPATDTIPVRLGSGAIIFEPALMGKAVGDKDIGFEAAYGQGENLGKKVLFNITINKAKTRIKVEAETDAGQSEQQFGAGAESEHGNTDGVVADSGARESELQPEAGGSGHEEPSHSDDQPLQQ